MEIDFIIPREHILNSNAMTSMHYHKKGKISAILRDTGYDVGFENLPPENKDIITERKEIFDIEEKNKIIKSRLRKKIKKNNPNFTAKEVTEKLEEEFKTMNLEPERPYNSYSIDPLFRFFEITAKISAPTRRRIDPANLYPTVKHLIDGLTIAGFWIDDDWRHLHKLSFMYGGIHESKKDFGILLEIEELKPEVFIDYDSMILQ